MYIYIRSAKNIFCIYMFAYLDVRPAEEHEYDVGVVLLDSYDEGGVAIAVADVGICLG